MKKIIWCNVHHREATHKYPDGTPRCNPNLGGILLPCLVKPFTVKEVEELDEKLQLNLESN